MNGLPTQVALLAAPLSAILLGACDPSLHGNITETVSVHGETLLMDRNVYEGKPVVWHLDATSFRPENPVAGLLATGPRPALVSANAAGIQVERLSDHARCDALEHQTLAQRAIWRSNEKWVIGANWDETLAVRWSDCSVHTFRGHGAIDASVGAVLTHSEFVVPSWESAIRIDLDTGQERTLSNSEVTHLRYLSEDKILVATHTKIAVFGREDSPIWSVPLEDHRLAYTGIAGNEKIVAYHDFHEEPLRVLDTNTGTELGTFESGGAGVAVLGKCVFAPRAERGVAYLKMWSPSRGVITVKGSDTPWIDAHLYPVIGTEAFPVAVAALPNVILRASSQGEVALIRGNWSECLVE